MQDPDKDEDQLATANESNTNVVSPYTTANESNTNVVSPYTTTANETCVVSCAAIKYYEPLLIA